MQKLQAAYFLFYWQKKKFYQYLFRDGLFDFHLTDCFFIVKTMVESFIYIIFVAVKGKNRFKQNEYIV